MVEQIMFRHQSLLMCVKHGYIRFTVLTMYVEQACLTNYRISTCQFWLFPWDSGLDCPDLQFNIGSTGVGMGVSERMRTTYSHASSV
jgi:hypothetical protein